jgi:hypothetical protein
MSQAGAPYLAAVRYEFTVLQNYQCHYVKDGALIIKLADHQPIAHVTGPVTSARVPIHFISRDPALLDPFLRMGDVPGIASDPSASPKGMQDFLMDFLTAFSMGHERTVLEGVDRVMLLTGNWKADKKPSRPLDPMRSHSVR